MAYAYSVVKERNTMNVSTDRILKIIPGEGGASNNTRSTLNMKLFSGDTRLHAMQDAGLWRLEYRRDDGRGAGALPEPLQQRWTSFNQLLKFLTPYFASRNIKIEEIVA